MKLAFAILDGRGPRYGQTATQLQDNPFRAGAIEGLPEWLRDPRLRVCRPARPQRTYRSSALAEIPRALPRPSFLGRRQATRTVVAQARRGRARPMDIRL